jgi:rubrerythrin
MTEDNVKAAMAGESQAHIKYAAFAAAAEKEGKTNIARLFRAISFAEQVHATHYAGLLGLVGSTEENLKAAHGGEDFEVENMYPAFIAVANAEGDAVAEKGFHYAIEAEKIHRPLYKEALGKVAAGGDLGDEPIYICNHCGHTGVGEAPDKCPICGNPKKNFLIF